MTTSTPDCRLRIHLLGSFRILRDGRPLAFGRKMPRKPLGLLKMIAACGGQGVAVGIIAARLWPELDGEAAIGAFDVTLYRLRRILDIPGLLCLSDGRLWLDSRQCWVDVWAFEVLVGKIEAAVREPLQGGDSPVRVITLQLLATYAGHFLEHEAHERWALAFRDRLKEKFLRAILALGTCLEANRRWCEAAALYARALELDNLAERIHRRLIVCYRELGETAEALRAYRRCRELLSLILGIPPSAETEAVRATLPNPAAGLRIVSVRMEEGA